MKRTLIALCLVLGIACFFVPLTGCSTADIQAIKDTINQADQQKTAYEQIMADANSQLAKARIQAATLPDGPEKVKAEKAVAQLQTVYDSAKIRVDQITEIVSTLNERMKVASDAPGVIEAFSATAGATVPQPYGLWIALAGTTLAGFLRAAQNRAAARNIAASVDGVLTDDQKAKIAGQSATARKIVDEAQGTKARLPV